MGVSIDSIWTEGIVAQIELFDGLVEDGVDHELEGRRQLLSLPGSKDITEINHLKVCAINQHVLGNPTASFDSIRVATQVKWNYALKIQKLEILS